MQQAAADAGRADFLGSSRLVCGQLKARQRAVVPENLDEALWDSDMARALMERIAHQEQLSASSSETVGTLRQCIDTTEARLAEMVQRQETELREQQAQVQ